MSARQPRDDTRPLDTTLPGVEDEELPPISGEVASQRVPATRDETAIGALALHGLTVHVVAEPAPPPAPIPAAQGPVAPLVVEVTAEITTRPAIERGGEGEGDPRSFLGAVRAAPPTSFGALLDDALALGS